jgi:hypothetical protein
LLTVYSLLKILDCYYWEVNSIPKSVVTMMHYKAK